MNIEIVLLLVTVGLSMQCVILALAVRLLNGRVKELERRLDE